MRVVRIALPLFHPLLCNGFRELLSLFGVQEELEPFGKRRAPSLIENRDQFIGNVWLIEIARTMRDPQTGNESSCTVHLR